MIGLGVAGLGRGFTLMLPTLARHPEIRLVAAADPRRDAREQFARDFAGRTYDDVARLCDDPDVEAVYVATPHQYHLEHVRLAARAGRHVLVEKPMALELGACRQMIEAARDVVLVVGHSHSFDAPYGRARAIIEGGDFGRVRMITALDFTDFLYRPRRPEELDTARGGGVVFSQAAHQVDVVRLLGGGLVRSLRAMTGQWDPGRPCEGAYSAFLQFETGAFATLTYSGYGHFDSDEFQGWAGELGQPAAARSHGAARARLRGLSPGQESALKEARAYGRGVRLDGTPLRARHNHFGLVIASCDRADLRPGPDGVMVYADDRQFLDALPDPAIPRAEVIEELVSAIRDGTPPIHSGAWGLATMEVCLAILRSAAERREVRLGHQCAVGAG